MRIAARAFPRRCPRAARHREERALVRGRSESSESAGRLGGCCRNGTEAGAESLGLLVTLCVRGSRQGAPQSWLSSELPEPPPPGSEGQHREVAMQAGYPKPARSPPSSPGPTPRTSTPSSWSSPACSRQARGTPGRSPRRRTKAGGMALTTRSLSLDSRSGTGSRSGPATPRAGQQGVQTPAQAPATRSSPTPSLAPARRRRPLSRPRRRAATDRRHLVENSRQAKLSATSRWRSQQG